MSLTLEFYGQCASAVLSVDFRFPTTACIALTPLTLMFLPMRSDSSNVLAALLLRCLLCPMVAGSASTRPRYRHISLERYEWERSEQTTNTTRTSPFDQGYFIIHAVCLLKNSYLPGPTAIAAYMRDGAACLPST